MSEWRPLQDDFQDELHRHDGLADDTEDPHCGLCLRHYDANYVADTPVDPTTPAAHLPRVNRIFKCRTCGAFLQCEACCLVEHARWPLHVIEVRSCAHRENMWELSFIRNGTASPGLRHRLGSLVWSSN
jgi:hypothetical protein